jgi:hypothetical protein
MSVDALSICKQGVGQQESKLSCHCSGSLGDLRNGAFRRSRRCLVSSPTIKLGSISFMLISLDLCSQATVRTGEDEARCQP